MKKGYLFWFATVLLSYAWRFAIQAAHCAHLIRVSDKGLLFPALKFSDHYNI